MAVSKGRRRVQVILAVFWTSVVAWMFWNMQARGVDPAVSQSTASVSVSSSSAARVFTPTTDTVSTGLIFYPGALADPEAYVPMARAIADAGYKVVVLDLPFRLAPFERHREQLAQRTLAVIRDEGEPRSWIIGGHSKGGKLAAQFARDHGAEVAGLLLVGTSHPREDDLSRLAMDVTKVYGSEDGLASEEEVHRFATNLPEATHWTRIEGGNHAQFAWYGWQLGDGRATIPRSEQHAATIRAVLDQLRRVGEGSR